MELFISCSAENRNAARRLTRVLEDSGIAIRRDESGVRPSILLGKELQRSIEASRALVLLWSAPASRSRYVNAEWLGAVHQSRFIVPCVLDKTPLPVCLQNTARLDVSRVDTALAKRLSHHLETAPSSANRLTPVLRSKDPELKRAIAVIVAGQRTVNDRLARRDLGEAAAVQTVLDGVVEECSTHWRLEPMLSGLAGFHFKNAYMLKHWDAIQAGRAPQDPLLAQAERKFFETLSVDPMDASALSGLGSTLIFRQDLDAAEFFIRAAVGAAEKVGMPYAAAKADLEFVRYFKKQS
jgi:hypothetical protein